MAAHVLTLRRHEFVLWRPARTEPPPLLVIGQLQSGAPVTLAGERSVELTPSPHGNDLWSVEARRCGLEDGKVYHYWFEVTGAAGHVSEAGGKQVDPVNFSRLEDDWRSRVKDHVGRLVHLRTSADALAVNDVEVLHVDVDGKRVVVWRRGRAGSEQQVVVVANFSDYTTPPGPSAEYVVPTWPPTPPGRRWREVTQARDVPPEWVGREPIFSWEAGVYATV